MKVIVNIFLAFLIIGLSSCNQNGQNRIETTIRIDSLDNNKIKKTETVITYKGSSDTILSKATNIENVNDDYKTFLFTGIQKKDGMKPWLIDSLFYNENGFDTTIVIYKFIGDSLTKNQVIKLKYDNKKLIYYHSERFNNPKISLEEFYTYNKKNQKTSKTRYECDARNNCDSIYKDLFYYGNSGKLDSSVMLIRKDNNWVRFKRKKI